MTKKKIVIRVCISGESPLTLKKFVVDFLKLKYFVKCWGHKSQCTVSKNQRKILSTATKISGEIEKVAIEGEEKNELIVIGEGIDELELVTRLRKKVGFANIVSVGPVDKKKEEEKKPIVPFFYGNYQMPPLQIWEEVRDPYSCYFW